MSEKKKKKYKKQYEDFNITEELEKLLKKIREKKKDSIWG